MARLLCKCGETLSNGLAPNDIQYWVYSDITMDKIAEKNCIDVVELWGNRFDYDVWRCPKCKRLYVFELQKNIDPPIYKNAPTYVYKLEDE